ncbi:hypothetical protein [Brevundimonas sp.]|uniref:hypothetical protein n=1 Tax=Brevundimonas sp. TaxID=1871086 RepID=UPI002FC7B76C
MRFEPNALLAVTTGCALGVLIGSAAIFGEAGQLLKYVLIAIVVTALYVPLNSWMKKRAGQQVRPLIHLESQVSAMWSNMFPAVIALAAFIPVIWMGHDYGLLIVIASVWFAGTVASALAARKAA